MDYEINELSKEQYDWFHLITTDWARKKYNPLNEFKSKLEGWDASDKQLAWNAFLATSWNEPSAVQLRMVQSSLDGVKLLFHLQTGLEMKDVDELVTEENRLEMYKKLVSGPDLETVLKNNERMKAIIETALGDINGRTGTS